MRETSVKDVKTVKRTYLNLKELMSVHRVFLVLLFLAGLLRFLYISDGVIPFGFDHGKDSIAVLHMLQAGKLKFIGPWTSIPGLNFGPAWYYLLAPFYLLFDLNPIAGVYAMIFLVLFQMFLAYKYFNIESAVLIGFTAFWINISRSAWNPFPMTLLTLIILILLKKQLSLKKISNKIIFSLFFTASFGFHFSTAFAIFYPIIIITTLLVYKFKPTLKNLGFAILGFAIPFIPQGLFEVKNNFFEVKAVITYIQKGEKDGIGIEKILRVLNVTLGEFRLIILQLPERIVEYSLIFFVLVLTIALFLIIKDKKIDKDLKQIFSISALFIVFPVIGFFFLHFNVWYVLPIIPVITILVGTIINKSSNWLSTIFVVFVVISAFAKLNFYLTEEKPKFMKDFIHLPVKRDIMTYIREDAGDRYFSVYTYVSDIYDFSFQYLFMSDAINGERLPSDFAYRPNITPYVHEKNEILEKVEKKDNSVEVIYYIVTDHEEHIIVKDWWNHQEYDEIIEKEKISPKLKIYTATPKKD